MNMVSEVNWNAIGAIGQWVGALATFGAVLVALKQNKPKVKVTSIVGNEISFFGQNVKGIATKKNKVFITATNIGLQPVTITHIGFKYSNCNGIINPDPQYGTLPKILMPSESITVWTDAQDSINNGIDKFDIAIAHDSGGNTYYHEATFVRKILRRLGWTLGRYKYYKK